MHYFFQSILMNIFILNIQLTQHTTPIAKFRVSFDAHFCVDRWASLVEKIPFLQYHQDTTWEHCQDTTETPKTWTKHPKHHWTPSKHYTTDTPPKCHQDTKNHRNKTDKPPRHQHEGHNQFPQGKGFSQKVVANIFCHDIFSPSPSSRITINATPSQQQRHHSTIIISSSTIIITIIFIMITFFFSPNMPTSSTSSTTTTSSLFMFDKFQFVHLQNEIHRCTCRYVNINISYWRRRLSAGASMQIYRTFFKTTTTWVFAGVVRQVGMDIQELCSPPPPVGG